MEEADLRLAEIKKESYEFDRDIVKGAVNQRTGKVIAEKVIRYFEDRLRARVCVTVTCLIHLHNYILFDTFKASCYSTHMSWAVCLGQ